MPDETVASGGAGAGAAVVEAPAQPAVTATPAKDSTTQVSAGVTTPAPEMQPGESPKGFIHRSREQREAEAAKAAEAGKAAEPAKVVEPAKTDEAKAAEAAKVAEAAKAEEKPAVEVPEEEPATLDEHVPIDPKSLAAKLSENPELAKALDAAGLKDSIFANARIAVKAQKILDVVGDEETATYMRGQAESFGEFQELFADSDTPDKTRALIGKMLEFSYLLDPATGQPLKDEQGRPLTDGTIGAFLENVFELQTEHRAKFPDEAVNSPAVGNLVLAYLAGLEKQAGSLPEDDREELKASIDILKARIDRGTASAKQEDQSEEQKAQAESLKTEKADLDRRQQEMLQKEHKEFEDAIGGDIEKGVSSLVDPWVNGSTIALPEGVREAVGKQIREGIYDKLKGNRLFTDRRDELMRMGRSPETQKKRVALALNSAKLLVKSVAQPILRQFGATAIQNQEERNKKIAAQVAASKSEIPGGGVAKAAQAPANPELAQQVKDEYFAKHHEYPDTKTLLRLVREKRVQQ